MPITSMKFLAASKSGDRNSRTHKYQVQSTGFDFDAVYAWLLSGDITTGGAAGLAVDRPNDSTVTTGRPLQEQYDDRILSNLKLDLKRDSDPEIWEAIVTYEPEKLTGTALVPSQQGSSGIEFSFETGPENETIRYSLQTVDTVGPGTFSPDFKGAINVQEDGSVEGVQIPSAPQQFAFRFTNNAAFFSAAKRNEIGRARGKVNSAAINVGGVTYAAGEVRFLAASGSISSSGDSSVDFRFGIRENVTGIQIPDMTATLDKDGWDYLWVHYVKSVSAGAKGKKPVGAYVERILYRTDLNALFA